MEISQNNLKSSPEIVAAREISNDAMLLQVFWEERYRIVYAKLFDEVSEFGRYGVIAEYIHRICPDSFVLDVGCGTGVLSMFLPSANYSGIDLSETAIDTARRKFPEKDFQCIDVRNFHSAPTYGTTVFNESLYYLNPIDIHKVLKHINTWSVHPHMVILSFYSTDKEGKETFDIFKSYVSVFDEVCVNKINNIHSWTIVAGFLKAF